MMTILEAMNDPKFFGPFFKRRLLHGDTWKNWRVFLAALFGLPMDAEQLAIYQKHTGRIVAPTEQFTEGFCINGRRGGKSRISALIGTYLAAFRNYDEYLAPGERGVLMILASDRTQAKNILNYVNGFFDSVPVLKAMVVNRLKESIELNNRVDIAVHTASFTGTRGYTLIGVIADELAFWRNEENSANPAAEVLAAVRPGMSTIPNALLLGISSAYSKHGVLFDAFKQHYGKDDSSVLVWKASSREMNPTINPVTLAVAYARDAASARSEYGGEFREDIHSLFDLEAIERLIVPGRQELAPVQGVTYSAFVDPSGGRADSMVLAVSHLEKGRSMAILDVLREVVPPFSPEEVTNEFAEILKKYRVHEVEGDRYGAQWVEDAFEKRGVRYVPSERNRSGIYLEFLPMVTSGQCALLDNRKLVDQLVDLDRSTGRGADVIDHPRGSHDDIANAAAGALVRALAGGGLVLSYANAVVEAQGKHGDAWREYIGKDESAELPTPLATPTVAEITKDRKLCCPQCGSTCVVRRGALYHCNVDGFEFAVPGAPGIPFSLDGPKKGQRGDALDNTPQERKWRGR